MSLWHVFIAGIVLVVAGAGCFLIWKLIKNSVVPRPLRIGVSIFAGCAALAAAILLLFNPDAGWHGCVVALLGVFFSAWLLALGFVYEDARQRAMQPVLWVLAAIFIPHLLGFLLYFALRQPFAAICVNCGGSIGGKQRFCPLCGHPLVPPPTENSGAGWPQSC